MAVYNQYNPIRTVAPIGGSPSYIPVPSKYEPDYSDVSASNAGRTEDTRMHKLMLGTCVHIGLSWAYLEPTPAQEVMVAFAPEYFNVEYLDVRTGTYQTTVFYCGDKHAEMVQTPQGVRWNLSFNIIERTAR